MNSFGLYETPWLLLRPIEKKVIVTNVDTLLVKSIPIGSEIIAIDGKEIKRKLEEDVFPYIASGTEQLRLFYGISGRGPYAMSPLTGPINTKLSVTIKTLTGEIRKITLTRDLSSRKSQWVRVNSQLPPVEFRLLNNNIAYVALNSFSASNVISKFDSIAPMLKNSNALIIDLRTNSGGDGTIPLTLLKRHIISDTFFTAPWQTRISNSTFRALGQNDGKYKDFANDNAFQFTDAVPISPDSGYEKVKGQIIFLTSAVTQSAAEDMLIYAKSYGKKVTIIGERTGGTTGLQKFFSLPGGGTARICVKRDKMVSGEEFVGYGIIPDIEISPTIKSLIGGRDIVLEKACEVIKKAL